MPLPGGPGEGSSRTPPDPGLGRKRPMPVSRELGSRTLAVGARPASTRGVPFRFDSDLMGAADSMPSDLYHPVRSIRLSPALSSAHSIR